VCTGISLFTGACYRLDLHLSRAEYWCKREDG
jgi:hypothetical protein